MKICFIGTGNLADALISGFLKSKIVKKEDITGTDIRREKLRFISNKYKIKTASSNIELIKKSNVIILSVKPKDVETVLKEISGNLTEKQLVVSVCAGITTKFIEKFLDKIPVIRVMPNTPVSVNEGMTVICKGKHSSVKHLRTVIRLFESVGMVMIKEEKFFNIITAISGSGPGYIFYFAEYLMKSAEQYGIDFNEAKTLITQTFSGAGKMLKLNNATPESLRTKVTSPGGTTQAAIDFFEKNRLNKIILEGIERAVIRAKQLTK